ncbi:hypothetical protein BEWA_005730 [Theileria equi strain WA]|uniref:Uncharacterized protein n=1 Tax=Theileria equi strain WA TaxID=1537102 RepID=L0B019_THEEQ|nr:hypothetical protein BEWA_005730 [Theileria equi strain WA]AFZ81165.1 hypothetical protein BEWA_005730 [Theileria equi strain WA]|eukprot:XP_004830831.1 hypothetical protein BEWA_005730 [Theileria equi strain WA]
MVRRNNVFEVVRTSRNRRFPRFGNQNRPRGRFSSGNQRSFGNNNVFTVRRVYKTKSFKGGVSSFGRRNFRRNADEKTTIVVKRGGRNFRGSKFERNNNRTPGRFNRRFDRRKQNSKNEKKTQDEMV